jgi:hypothetical protein
VAVYSDVATMVVLTCEAQDRRGEAHQTKVAVVGMDLWVAGSCPKSVVKSKLADREVSEAATDVVDVEVLVVGQMTYVTRDCRGEAVGSIVAGCVRK